MRSFAEALYDDAVVDDVVIDQAASFDERNEGSGIRSIVLLCDSEHLERISYKPDFPQSIFHLTLFEGPESLLAERVLEILQSYPWQLRLNMKLRRFSSSAEANASSTIAFAAGGWFTEPALREFRKATTALGIEPDVAALDDDQRILVATYLCDKIHTSPDVRSVESENARDYLRLEEFNNPGQLSFWSAQDISSLSSGGAPLETGLLRKHSTFITPPELAFDLVEVVDRFLEADELVDFGDPAIGAGILFAALRHKIGDGRLNSARGVEIDVSGARRTLHRWRNSRLSVLVGDFIEVRPEPDTWTLVLANPPYRRSQQLPRIFASVRERLERELGLEISARSDLYLYFMLRAHAWMAKGALAAWVIPAEFQVTDYAQSLRVYLSTKVQLLRVHTYDERDRQFDNALTSTSVVIFRNTPPARGDVAEFSSGGSLQFPSASVTRDLDRVAGQRRWSFSFMTSAESTTSTLHLGDFFDVKRGIATGANSLFVLTAAQVDFLEVDRRWIRPLFPKARLVPDSIIRADKKGDPEPQSELWLIDTTDPLESIEARSSKFGFYLRSIREKASQSALVRRREPFYSQERRPSPVLAFVYMAKSDVPSTRRFIANYSSSAILNNYLALYPKAFLQDKLSSEPDLLRKIHEALGQISVTELMVQGRMYGHGLLKLEPKELQHVRLTGDNIWIALAQEN